jgi:hypothetical protein
MGNFGVPGMNWSGTRMVQFCTEAGPIAGNSLFKMKRVNKYTWLRDNGLEKEFMEWMLVDKRLKDSLEDINLLSS